MERRQLICIGVCFLGLLAAALGFAAESKRIKRSDIEFYSSGECTYPKSPAFALGLTAFLLLVVAHAIINASAGCICCNNSAWMSLFAVLSWSMFALASILLLVGSVLNNRHTMDDPINFCYGVREPWIFVNGALLGLLSVTFGIFYFITHLQPTA
ncbi:uncharacterized protein LOC113274140 [Papaver somniferum]|nr:uncharacterized protein LOC113274140 [Papaver somniferum]XP_026379411.1 uncharacterized protein LOC113274140 [Papaver somniferum]XP_026379412.1 uncharacterized protein LOC113274140 [Papaver somniferum]